jgi:peptide deformylase
VSVLPIIKYPDPTLKKLSKPVHSLDRDIRSLVEDMSETMHDASGVGLAAPQIGHLLRVIVVDVSSVQEGSEPVALINPEVVWSEGDILWEEGCLSVPELTVEIPRKERVKVTGVDLAGRPLEVEAQGLFAIALQHELDHLNGRLIIDRLSSLKREFYRKKRLKDEVLAGL